MKKRVKCLLLAMVLALAMCVPAFAEVVTEYNGTDAETIIEYYQDYVITNSISLSEDEVEESITYYEGYGYDGIAAGYEELKELLDEIRDAEVTESRMETTDDEDAPVEVIYELSNDNGEFVCTLSLDESFSVVSLSYARADEAAGNLSEQLKDAALNTVVGLIVVFSVLALISCIIALLKYLPGSDVKKKSAEVPSGVSAGTASANPAGTGTVPAAAPAQNLISDGELVAVISAAVAASMGTTSTEGFVVRSIKKRKWK